MLRSLTVVCLVLAAGCAVAQTGCNGKPNTIPLYTAEPELVKTVANGALYVTGPATLNPRLSVVHVSGTAMEMGQAYGELMKAEITTLFPEVMTYIVGQINPYIKSLPEQWRAAIDKYGPEVALDLIYDATKAHIPQHFTDMAQGMSNSTGIDWEHIVKLSLFPELIRMSCSMVGAWGPATANHGLLQLRALDWSTDGPFQQFPVVLVMHPAAGNGHSFASMSWAGLMGSITGMSSAGIGVSEKVWLHRPSGLELPFGVPDSYLLQDILQFDNDTDQALSRIASATRTWSSIFIGIGDKKNQQFKAIEYSQPEVNIYNSRNFPTYENHDLFESLVFVDKHTQPSHDPCLNSLMHLYYGKLTPEVMMSNVTALFETGDMHIAVYSFQDNLMYVSNASPMIGNDTSSVIPAYNRPFIRLNMTTLFAHE